MRVEIQTKMLRTDHSDMPPIFVPTKQLGEMAADTQCASVLAVYPENRRRAKRAMVKGDWNNPGHGWILMLK